MYCYAFTTIRLIWKERRKKNYAYIYHTSEYYVLRIEKNLITLNASLRHPSMYLICHLSQLHFNTLTKHFSIMVSTRQDATAHAGRKKKKASFSLNKVRGNRNCQFGKRLPVLHLHPSKWPQKYARDPLQTSITNQIDHTRPFRNTVAKEGHTIEWTSHFKVSKREPIYKCWNHLQNSKEMRCHMVASFKYTGF